MCSHLSLLIVKIIVKENSMSRLKQIRLEKGLRQLDLAKKANISLTWLWALENSFSSRVSREIKGRVAQALDCPYEELFPDE